MLAWAFMCTSTGEDASPADNLLANSSREVSAVSVFGLMPVPLSSIKEVMDPFNPDSLKGMVSSRVSFWRRDNL